MSSSWSEGRESRASGPSVEKKREHVRQINAVLEKFSKDDDFQDDLRMAEVQRALKHWTGESRLPQEEAQKLQDHRRVVYVLQRLQIFTQVCREAGIKVPLHLMLQGAKKMPDNFVRESFGADSLEENKSTTNSNKEKEKNSAVLKENNASAVSKKENSNNKTATKPSAPETGTVLTSVAPQTSAPPLEGEASKSTAAANMEASSSSKTHLLYTELITTGVFVLFAVLFVLYFKKNSTETSL